MSWLKFSVAVVLTSVALVLAVFATGAFVFGNAIAHAAPLAQMRDHSAMDSHNLPTELASLRDVPNAEKFAHFQGIQVALTDKDGNPVAISVTPGLASSVGSDSITVAGNDGANHTYQLTDQTWQRGGTQVADGDQVVVVTLNDTTSARAVVDVTAMQQQHAK
jgi:hypothetical protein